MSILWRIQMSLSDKLVELHDLKKREQGFAVKAGDIKDFIKELKDWFKGYERDELIMVTLMIDELSGERLI